MKASSRRWLVMLVLCVAGPSWASWSALGTPVLQAPAPVAMPHIVSNGPDQIEVGWLLFRGPAFDFANQFEPYVLRLDGNGQIAPGWPAGGVATAQPTASGISLPWQLEFARSGNLLISGYSCTSGCNSCGCVLLGLQVVNTDGTLGAEPYIARDFVAARSDGAGGWYDFSRFSGGGGTGTLRVNHLSSTGSLIVSRLLTGGPGHIAGQATPLPDGAGGAYLLYGDYAVDTVRFTRVNSGLVYPPGWPVTPLPTGIRSHSVLRESAGVVAVVGVNASGAWLHRYTAKGVALSDTALPVPGPRAGEPVNFVRASNGRLFAFWKRGEALWSQVLAPDGTCASGDTAGRVFCEAPLTRDVLNIASDQAGGMNVLWRDGRDGVNQRVFAISLDTLGIARAGWPVNGVSVTPTGHDAITPDARAYADRAELVWLEVPRDSVGSATTTRQLYARVVPFTAPAAPSGVIAYLWVPTPDSVTLRWQAFDGTSTGNIARSHDGAAWQTQATLTRDPDGFFSFVDRDVQPQEHWLYRLQDGAGIAVSETIAVFTPARIIFPPPPLPNHLTLAQVRYSRRVVQLVWSSTTGPDRALIHRSIDGDAWTPVGDVPRQSDGRYPFDDPAPPNGTVCAYRVQQSDGAVISDTAFVTIPVSPPLELTSVTRPTGSQLLVVDLKLEDSGEAMLDLFDITGRRIAERTFPGFQPGAQHVELTLPGHSGLVFLRLRQGSGQILRRIVDVR